MNSSATFLCCCVLAWVLQTPVQAQTHHPSTKAAMPAASDSTHRHPEALHVWHTFSSVRQSFGALSATEVALAIQKGSRRAAFDVIDGRSHVDAAGHSFGTRYGYVAAHSTYTQYRLSLTHQGARWTYGGTLQVGPSAPSPDLRMDERKHEMWTAFVGFRGHQIFVERMYHRMDNRLRHRMADMDMSTDLFVAGLRGNTYEVSYHAHDTWHGMGMPATMNASHTPRSAAHSTPTTDEPRHGASMDAARHSQHVIPDLHEVRLAVSHTYRRGRLALGSTVGVRAVAARDEAVRSIHRILHPTAQTKRLFLPLTLEATYTTPLSGSWAATWQGTVAIAPPEPTELFLSVQRGPEDVSWLGNPTLSPPKQALVSGAIMAKGLRAEVHAAVISDYVAVAPDGLDGPTRFTFSNTDAFEAGVMVRAEGTYFSGTATYTWARQLHATRPLAGVPPLHVVSSLRLPVNQQLRILLRGEGALAQHRVDNRVAERSTSAWGQLSGGAEYDTGPVVVTAEVTNLTDSLYRRHRPHVRNPFSSTDHVFEPGRTLRLGLSVRF